MEGERYQDLDFNGDVLATFGDFQCRWRVRNEEYGKIMEREAKAAENVLEHFPPYE